MVVKLYGFIHSTSTHLVFLVLKELNVPYEFVVINMAKGEHKSPEYLAKHPFGVVPFMDDDGFQLCESRAICRYLLATHDRGTSLAPTEPKAQALSEQAISIESSYFQSPASTIFHEKILAKHFGKETDQARYEEAVKKIESTFDIYEVMLGKHKYLAGNEVTLGDLCHIPLGRIVHSLAPEIFSKRPNVARWWSDLIARPSSLALTEAIQKGSF